MSWSVEKRDYFQDIFCKKLEFLSATKTFFSMD